MQNKRFRPLLDKLFWIIWVPTALVMLTVTLLSIYHIVAFLLTLLVDVFVFYFLISPLFGYVELREDSVFIKFGLLLKREIPYGKIRGVTEERKFYADSMLSLKNALVHINIKYNSFDMVSVSVVGNGELKEEIEARTMGGLN